MSTRRPAPDNLQPEKFAFTKENAKAINNILLKYPEGRKASALLALLDLAQRQHDNWLPKAAMSEVAKILSLPMIKVLEVATFYTMYNLYPVGKNLLQICTTTPCWLRGSEDIVSICKDKLGINFGATTKDNRFTLLEVECLGACSNAPMIQINDDFYEDLTKESMKKIIEDLKNGKQPKIGPQSDRKGAEPINIKVQI
ncbi:MAG TPA: NADH-quinone oxidoreductase subunit NuoE [Alphaproteobacteria bacterium]|nr:NADH-quinone oxidoreductase subunit NuoE [Alphaproteobacteria bacterium]